MIKMNIYNILYVNYLGVSVLINSFISCGTIIVKWFPSDQCNKEVMVG